MRFSRVILEKRTILRYLSLFEYNNIYLSQIALYLFVVHYDLIAYNLKYRLIIYNRIFFLKKRLESKYDNRLML